VYGTIESFQERIHHALFSIEIEIEKEGKMNRINENDEVEKYNEWTGEWEVWECPRCKAKEHPDGYTPHSVFCPLQ